MGNTTNSFTLILLLLVLLPASHDQVNITSQKKFNTWKEIFTPSASPLGRFKGGAHTPARPSKSTTGEPSQSIAITLRTRCFDLSVWSNHRLIAMKYQVAMGLF